MGCPPRRSSSTARPTTPPAGSFLDDLESVEALRHRVAEESPALVVIDTVGMTTDRNLGKPEEARHYFEPLMKIANEYRTSFLLLTHLSKDAQQALGRRIVGASRVVWKLTQPDPEGQPDRRKLWVDKSYALKPPALGMTIAAEGCTFDAEPPEEASRRRRPDRSPSQAGELQAMAPRTTDANPGAAQGPPGRGRGERAMIAKLLYRAYEALGGRGIPG